MQILFFCFFSLSLCAADPGPQGSTPVPSYPCSPPVGIPLSPHQGRQVSDLQRSASEEAIKKHMLNVIAPQLLQEAEQVAKAHQEAPRQDEVDGVFDWEE